MKSATEGQLHAILATLLTGANRKLIDFDAIQKLIKKKPELVAQAFVDFLNTSGNEGVVKKPKITLYEFYLTLTQDENCQIRISEQQFSVWKDLIIELLNDHRKMTDQWDKQSSSYSYFSECYKKFDEAKSTAELSEAFTFFAQSEKWK